MEIIELNFPNTSVVEVKIYPGHRGGNSSSESVTDSQIIRRGWLDEKKITLKFEAVWLYLPIPVGWKMGVLDMNTSLRGG